MRYDDLCTHTHTHTHTLSLSLSLSTVGVFLVLEESKTVPAQDFALGVLEAAGEVLQMHLLLCRTHEDMIRTHIYGDTERDT